jgi:sirohydrochlorin cobaltochelatase
MHGAPPNDFPKREMGEMFSLHAQLESGVPGERGALERRYAELDAKMRAWPRSSDNDPFYAASHELAERLDQATKCEVIVGFNEFCAPALGAALDEAVRRGADRVMVITPMMTRGGEHATVDIPEAIQHAQDRHPAVPMTYVWPFEVSEVARFLAEQIDRFA